MQSSFPPLRLPLERPPLPLPLPSPSLIDLLIVPIVIPDLRDLTATLGETLLGAFAHQVSLERHFFLDGAEGGLAGDVGLERTEERETVFLLGCEGG
jgi:hypothetical protein